MARPNDTTEQMNASDVEEAMRLVRENKEAAAAAKEADTATTVPVDVPPTRRTTGDGRLGMELGNLRLEEKLGAGNMGAVYKATHMNLGTLYAVKILHPRLSNDAVVAERFRREAMTCSQLRHANVVLVTDFGLHKSLGLYLVMEHLEGRTLAERLEADGPVDLWELFQIFAEICAGLEAAHGAGAVHRDLKPENIFLSGDDLKVKILDFGIARISAGEASLTQAGATPGTPTYMSPEQIRGRSKELGPQTDLYALGIILYEALTGVHPLTGPNAIAVMHAHMTAERPSLAEWIPALAGTKMEQLALELLDIEPKNRPADAAALAQRLAEAHAELVQKGVYGALPPDGRRRPPKSESTQLPSVTWLTRILMKARPPRGAALSTLMDWNPDLGTLSALDVLQATWGFLMRDLLESEVGSGRFLAACEVLVAMGSRVLDSLGLERLKAQHSIDGAESTVMGIGGMVAVLLELGDKTRQQAVASACEPLLDHPLFPREALPAWARQDIQGSWRKMLGIFS